MKFSVCIPNYNYERYLGRTLASVLQGQGVDLEVVVSDNASTDGSVALVHGLDDARVRVRVNPCNVGFAGNLDRAAGMATGDVLLLLSSDDLVKSGTLAVYESLYHAAGPDAGRTLVTAGFETIDSEDRVTGSHFRDTEIWRDEDLWQGLPGAGLPKIYRVAGDELLRRCLASMKNPFNFLATAFPREVYERVGGYGGGRLINPDKWFHWKICAAGTHCYFIDASLFSYRVHGNNQNSLQAASGALKLLIDDYASVIELDENVLKALGLSRRFVEQTFVERDIGRHGLAELARGRATKARRILAFGASTYPQHAFRNKKVWALAALVALGPPGSKLAEYLYARRSRNRKLLAEQ